MKNLIAFILLISGIPTMAQEAQEAKKGREGRRTCRIVFPERPNDSPKVAFLFDGKGSQQVFLPSMNFSDVISMPSGDLTLLLTPAAITNLENLPPNAPRLKITEDIKDFYILVTPDPTNTILPLRMNLVNISADKLKPGETLWFNLTDHRILAKLQGSRLIAPPRGQAVSQAPMPASGYYRAEFAYQPQGEGDLQRIMEQDWWFDAKSRHVGFIVNTGGKLPKIFYYRDFR